MFGKQRHHIELKNIHNSSINISLSGENGKGFKPLRLIANDDRVPVGFVGRETEYENVRKLIQDNQIAVINGIGGIGKSSIARAFFSASIADETATSELLPP